jgi:colanic acid/amylovoran biosynthesis glycosyltransferase
MALAVELGINENVKFVGPVARDETPALYRQAHIFVLASVVTATGEEEGQSVALAEAQASGLPVIATLIGGIPESVSDGRSGLLVPQRDPQALASALTWMIEHQEAWGQMSRSGRMHVEENYDTEKLHDRLVDVYRAVLKRRDRGRFVECQTYRSADVDGPKELAQLDNPCDEAPVFSGTIRTGTESLARPTESTSPS